MSHAEEFTRGLLGVAPVAHISTIQGKTVMNFSSTIQVLKIETTDTKTINPETGKPFQRTAARAILLDDDGSVVTVGRLPVPRPLVDQVKTGTFRATFALQVPDWGDNKGDIVAVLTGLSPVQVRGAAPAAAPAPAKV